MFYCKSKKAILIACQSYLVSLILIWMLAAQTSLVHAKQPNDALVAAKTEMESVMANLEVDIRKAKDKLRVVADMDVQAQNQAVNEIFQGFKKRVVEALQGVDSNSELVDALQGAKEKTIRLQNWFSRQPPEYPHRDDFVKRLQTALDSYTKSENELNQQRDDAINMLSEIGEIHGRALQAIKVGQVEESVQAIQNVVSSLQALNTGLRQIVNDLNESEINVPAVAQ